MFGSQQVIPLPQGVYANFPLKARLDRNLLRVFPGTWHFIRKIGMRTTCWMVSLLTLLLALPLPVGAASGGDPAILQIRIVEGEGTVYPAGSHATRGVTVQVTDETGRPVEAAAVSFTLPEDGPGGTFATGAKSEVVTTRADGKASVWGMQWNRNAGSFEIRITAVKGETRAGAVCQQFLNETRAADSRPARVGLLGHKWVWIAVGVAGAAGAGVAAAASQSKPTAAGGVQIGAPSITLGRP